ncbi:hypothetical protein [Pedobacter alluvionis]|uniref:DUF4304 domain-containing protein n=1 Tax=Pedobacter alluvionis TaxID=475253 RepID=A0A497YDA4_9SPHI|nr:hypothetical protein [Pedobacter alluvionis]RLJ81004.1 hypothetical protein BCL90_0023 [Pedobacter alluvionis]TFB27887.1 hypothetical protein E3V97_24565 [Pedobacter alluvionis]
MRPEKEFAVTACKELEEKLSMYGFKTLSKGLLFKRKLNRDITQEIAFQITSHFDIIVHISISSEIVKRWNKDNFKDESGIMVTKQLGYLTPLQNWKTWNIMKSEIAKKQFKEEFLYQIEEYILPFFEKFNNINLLIEELIENNGSWTNYDKKGQVLPIEIVLSYKTVEDGQRLLNNFLKENVAYLKQIRKHKLHEMIEFDFKYSDFFGAIEFKKASKKGLTLNEIS